MALKYKYLNESEIPAEHKALYVKRENVWFLDADGAADATALAEFRNNNIELLRLTGASDMATAKQRLESLKEVDPVKYAEWKKKNDEAEGKKMIEAGKVDELLEQRTAEMKKEHAKQLQAKDDELKTVRSRLEVISVDGAIATAAAKKGVKSTAIPDIQARAKNVFKLDGVNVVAVDGEGKRKYGKDSKDLTIEEWMDAEATAAPHLFEPNSGSGGGGNVRAHGNRGGANPWNPKTLNRTEQARIRRENPQLAEQMETQAASM